MHYAYARILFLEWSTLTYPFGLGDQSVKLYLVRVRYGLACSFAGALSIFRCFAAVKVSIPNRPTQVAR
jgi:hypothetical protein